MEDFDVIAELTTLKVQTKLIRRRTYKRRRSKLEPYKANLFALKQEGASVAELQRYLRKKEITISHSAISRWLKTYG